MKRSLLLAWLVLAGPALALPPDAVVLEQNWIEGAAPDGQRDNQHAIGHPDADPVGVRLSDRLGLSLHGDLSLATDYVGRGISQTQGRPAAMLTARLQQDRGAFVELFVANVSYPGSAARQETDLSAGWRFTWLDIEWETFLVTYAYPPAPSGENLDYLEAIIHGERSFGPVTVLATFGELGNLDGHSGSGQYVELATTIALPLDFSVDAVIGHQSYEKNERFGVPDYSWGSVGLTHELVWGIQASVRWVGTSVPRARCDGGQTICGDRVVVQLSRSF